jgi:hypothetical protein
LLGKTYANVSHAFPTAGDHGNIDPATRHRLLTVSSTDRNT